MTQPLVTVVLPCYNAAPWLAETLDCLERQSHSNLQIVAIDDGSTDATWNILQGSRDRRLKALRQPNQGAALTRNAGIRLAEGDYLQFLDADDVMDAVKIESQVRAAQELGQGWVIASRWGRFRAEVANTSWEPLWPTSSQGGIDWLIYAWTTGDMMPPHGWLVSREIAEAAGPWNPEAGINDDGEFFCRVLLRAQGAVQVPEARVHYRSGIASFSQRTDPWAWESLLNSYELCADHMLAAQDSAVVRAAIARRLRGFQYLAYPRFPRLVARVDEIMGRLQLPKGTPDGGGRASRIAGKMLGWKLTRRLGELVRGMSR